MRVILLIGLLLQALCGSVQGQPEIKSSTTAGNPDASLPDVRQHLDDYFSELSHNRDFSGNVLVADKGRVVYEKSFGYADPLTKRLNTPDTRFPICSVTKTFVATAVLQLEEQGKLRLDDPAGKYIPDFPYRTVTVRQLLSHTSGLPAFYGTFDPLIAARPGIVLRNSDYVNCCRELNAPLMFAPGDRFNYNNANFVVLSIIVSQVSGTPAETYISKHVLEPLEMNDTFERDYFQLPTNLKNDVAVPYYWPHLYSKELIRTDTIEFLKDDAAHLRFSGYGDMISTLHDLLKYDQALYEGKLLKQATLDEAFQPVKLNDGRPNPGVWGLGWQIDRPGKMVNHGGGMAGMYVSFTRDLERRQTAIVFSISREALSRPVANQALRILNGEEVPKPRKSAAYLYGEALVRQGELAANRLLRKAKGDSGSYDINEDEFNAVGYDLMGDQFIYHLPQSHHYDEAVRVFKVNTELFPSSANTFDSYSEALARVGRKREAEKMLEEALRLRPDDAGMRERLRELRQDKSF